VITKRSALAFSRLAALAAVASLVSVASPARADDTPPRTRPLTIQAMTPIPERSGDAAAVGDVSNILFLNRCAGGCTYYQSTGTLSNSLAHQTWLGGDFNDGGVGSGAIGQEYNFPEFPYGDASWDAVVACVQETYRPYNVVVTDVDPGSTVAHHDAVVAGDPSHLGLPDSIGGVGPLYGSNGTCEAHDNTVSFTFANVWGDDPIFICSVIAQESAHGFGLEHAFNCSDPLTYLNACGRQFFRNEAVPCGEFTERPCSCTGGGASRQNTHTRLLNIFGPNPVPMDPPTVTLSQPANGATVQQQFTIAASGSDVRGLGKAEVLFNGYEWMEAEAERGQSLFVFTAPENLPDGVIDVEVRVYNDLETVYGGRVATVTKGAPCTTADTCLTGQRCDAGKCLWDPPAGALGDECAFDQYCTSGICRGTCTLGCNPSVTGDCPAEYECLGQTQNEGFCFAASEAGGCCSVADDGRLGLGVLAQLGLASMVLLVIVGRRRRR
jgi:hypothetical protein